MHYYDWKIEEALRAVLDHYLSPEIVTQVIAEVMSELKYR